MQVSVRWLTIILAAVATALLLLHIWLFWLDIYVYPDQAWVDAMIARFDVDSEASVPTWFGQMLLFVAGLLAVVVGVADKHLRHYWLVVAGLLGLLSLDEGSSFHETLGVWLGQSWGLELSLGFAVLRDWVILAGVAVLIVGLLLWRFVLLLPARTRWLLMSGAGLFVVGALGVETLHFTAFNFEFGSFAHRLSNAVEEALEMAGVIVVIYAIADYAARYAKPQRLKFYVQKLKRN